MALSKTETVARIVKNAVKKEELGVGGKKFLARADKVLDMMVTPEAEAAFAEFESRYFGNTKDIETKKLKAATKVHVGAQPVSVG